MSRQIHSVESIHKEFEEYYDYHNTLPPQSQYSVHFSFSTKTARLHINKTGNTIGEYIEKHFNIPNDLRRITKFTKEEIIDTCKKKIKELGYVPTRQNCKKEFGINHSTIESRFNMRYGPFIEMLGFTPNKRGYFSRDVKGKDGNIYKSNGEALFANLLFKEKIPYDKEIPYKKVIKTNRQFRFDFAFSLQGTHYLIEVSCDTMNKGNQEKKKLCKLIKGYTILWVPYNEVVNYKDIHTLIDDFA